MKQHRKTSTKGFTLIELAVVIAIIGILAAVAIPRLGGNEAGAQRAVAQDFVSQLNSASAMWTATYGKAPNDFMSFVTTGALPANPSTDPNNPSPNLSTQTLGPNPGTCTVSANTINCAAAFPKLSAATYTWSNGTITATVTAK